MNILPIILSEGVEATSLTTLKCKQYTINMHIVYGT